MTLESADGRVRLRPPAAEDADVLYGDLVGTRVTDTIVWDGPESLDAFREGLRERGRLARAGELHVFTVVETRTNGPIGWVPQVLPTPFHDNLRCFQHLFRATSARWDRSGGMPTRRARWEHHRAAAPSVGEDAA